MKKLTKPSNMLQIMLPKGEKIKLANDFKTSAKTVWQALSGKSSSPLALMLRKAAIERGGHTWLPSAYKPDSFGQRTKYYIRFYKTGVVTNPANVTIGTATNNIGGWPVYMVAKDMTMPAASFPGPSYVLKGYDHSGCKYSGNSANGLFGNAYHTSLLHIPADWVFTGTIITIGNAFCAPLLKTIDYSAFDFSKLTGSGGPTFSGANSCEEVVGVIDLVKQTGSLAISLVNCKEIRFANVNCAVSIANCSVFSEASLLSLIDALVDRSGMSALVLNVGLNGKSLPQSEWDRARVKGYTVTGTFN